MTVGTRCKYKKAIWQCLKQLPVQRLPGLGGGTSKHQCQKCMITASDHTQQVATQALPIPSRSVSSVIARFKSRLNMADQLYFQTHILKILRCVVLSIFILTNGLQPAVTDSRAAILGCVPSHFHNAVCDWSNPSYTDQSKIAQRRLHHVT